MISLCFSRAVAAEADLSGLVLKEVKAQIISRDKRLSASRIEAEFKEEEALSKYFKKGDSSISVKLDYPQNMKLAGNVVLPLSVYEKGKFKERVYLQTRIKIMSDVLVSAEKIRKGQAFTQGNTTYQEKDISFMPATVIFDASGIIGKESMTLIPKGSIILDWMARKVPDIKKGNAVSVFSLEGQVSVSRAAVALEDAYIGQRTHLKSLGSNKIMEAAVVSSTEAQIR